MSTHRKSKRLAGRHDIFLPPFVVPKNFGRMYFIFTKPIPTKGMYEAGVLSDKKATDELYIQAKAQVQDGIKFLLKKRAEDPYREFLPRLIYETTVPGKQAPTFQV
ncbi:hypothetical protein CBR_g24002 [Chara braunii]|uniref:Uncharacterized protein n=1 Tax=Chara braunii TaxID=69332 RepID=A0A388L5I1_CHABU|nr:hypothetical protein CBR_g24002 [Chara braunii]|eukprot:GBG77556.1 hypothetical protein CBR_g24002 [Chara braunii]